MSITVTANAYIINNRFSINPCEVPVNCSNYRNIGEGYFVLVSNEFSDNCGGFLEVGTEINANQTSGHDSDTFVHLYHIQYDNFDVWITLSPAELLEECSCTPTNFTEITDNGDGTFTATFPDGSGISPITWNTSAVAFQWQVSGDDIYYTAGKVTVGDNTFPAMFSVKGEGNDDTTYTIQLTNSDDEPGIVLRDDGFFGVGTNLSTQTWTDRFGLDPSDPVYATNFLYNIDGRALYLFGNTNTGVNAYTQLLIGNGAFAQYGGMCVLPKDWVGAGRKSSVFILQSGSGLEMGVFADYGQIQFGTVADTGSGWKAIVIGVDPFEYIAMGHNAPAYALDIRRGVNSDKCQLYVQNTTNGTASYAKVRVANNLGNEVSIGIPSSGNTTGGAYTPDTALLYSTKSINIIADTTGGYINLYPHDASKTFPIWRVGYNNNIDHYASATKYLTTSIDATTGDVTYTITSAGTPTFIFANRIRTTGLPTSNAGLITGDLYTDTAANILANGDKVVGMKA